MAENEGSSAEENSSKKKTVLYCFPREALSEQDIQQIANALESEGFELAASDGEGDNILVQKKVQESGQSLDMSEVLED